jgi:hypothetical protein
MYSNHARLLSGHIICFALEEWSATPSSCLGSWPPITCRICCPIRAGPQQFTFHKKQPAPRLHASTRFKLSHGRCSFQISGKNPGWSDSRKTHNHKDDCGKMDMTRIIRSIFMTTRVVAVNPMSADIKAMSLGRLRTEQHGNLAPHVKIPVQ